MVASGPDGQAGGVADGEALPSAILDSLDRLLAALQLDPLGDDRFVARAEAGQFGDRLFGGQLLAQALVAAGATVDGHAPQSLHGYFVGAGDPQESLELAVERVRDGRSVSTRQVSISQGERVLLSALVSFHTNPTEPVWNGPERASSQSAPSPERLPLLQDWARALSGDQSELGRSWIERPPPLEIRMAEAPSFLGGVSTEPARQHWMRLPRPVDASPSFQAALVAHASDYLLLDMLLRTHPHRSAPGQLSAFSLDHSLWFHRPVHLDRWHLCTQEAVALAGHRGLARGSIHDERGHLVATVAQEGLVRPTR